jgi:O-antigen ligase
MEHTFNDRKQRNASFLLALLISGKLLNAIVGMINDLLLPSGILVMGSIWVLFILYLIKYKVNFNFSSCLLIVYIMVFFIISNVISNGYTRDLTLTFIEYGILGFFIGSFKFNIENATRYVSYILLGLSMPIFITIQHSIESTHNGVIEMGLSYAILPLVFASFVHFIYFRKNARLLTRLSYAFSLILLIYLALKGTRGVVLCIVILFILVKMNTEKSRKRKYNFGAILTIIFSFICIVNIESIFQILNNYFNSTNLNINFIQKSLRLISNKSDITNGRMLIYEVAWKGFLRSPLVGNGIGSFWDMYPSFKYPHNMFLQVLFEGGLLLGLPIILLTMWCLYKVIFGKIKDQNYRIAAIMFVSCTIPAVMLSGELWGYQILWALFGMMLGGIKKYGSNQLY